MTVVRELWLRNRHLKTSR